MSCDSTLLRSSCTVLRLLKDPLITKRQTSPLKCCSSPHCQSSQTGHDQSEGGGVCGSVLFVSKGGRMWIWRGGCVLLHIGGGRELVLGVRFTLVRLVPLDIPDIPTSGMFEAPLSSSCLSGGC